MRRNLDWRLLVTGVLAAGSVLGLAACGDDDGDDSGSAATEGTVADPATDDTATDDTATDDTGDAGAEEGPAGGEIIIEGFAFTEDVTVPAGSDVSVENADGATHTVTSDSDAWEALRLGGGESGSFVAPSEAGEYPYFCEIHPSMEATLVVE